MIARRPPAPPPPRTRARALAVGAWLLCGAWAVGARPGAAQDRLLRTLGQEEGLTAAPVWALAQDSAGFVWIGAEGGLLRYDGVEIRRWATDEIADPVMEVVVSPAGEVVAMDARGLAHRVVGLGAEPLSLPLPAEGNFPQPSGLMAFDTAGVLYSRSGPGVAVLTPDGWRTLEPRDFGGETLRGVHTTSFGGALVATQGGLWRLRAGEPPQRLFRGGLVVSAVEPEEGRVAILLNDPATLRPRVVEIGPAGQRELAPPGMLPAARAVAMRERHGAYWLALDRFLVGLRDGREPEILDSSGGYESGGPLLVDAEGGLWMGSFVGLHLIPEPDARRWGERHGLPSRHTRFIARSGDVLWVMTWAGPAHLVQADHEWQMTATDWDTRSGLCRTEDGTVWTADPRSLLRLRGSSVTRVEGSTDAFTAGCTPDRAGGVWVGTDLNLVHIDADGRLTRYPHPPVEAPSDARPALLHDSADRIWVGAGPTLCHTDVSRLRAGDTSSWNCEPVAAGWNVWAMVEPEPGLLWAAAGRAGLFVWDGGHWSPWSLEDAPARSVITLVPSPRGGVWVVGAGSVVRVAPRPRGTVAVLERLTPWQGVSSADASDILEDASGDLWIANAQGVEYLPAAARFARPPVPRVALVEGRVDDERVLPDRVLDLPFRRNRIELRFAALSFRDRSGLRHQVRLGPDAPWSEAVGAPSFRWVDLGPGSYRAEYRASRDGLEWSAAPAAFAFRVLPPWYATSWFFALSGSILAGLGALLYRARVRHLVGLEQQRTRIALDLHDQIGSGLASVGILSGVMATDGLDPEERTRTAREIADVAEELGYSLSDIVWSLDPQTASIEELATRLAEHGERLFADGTALFQARFPPRWPDTRPAVAVRRGALLIGLEALHNAARHARASQVTLMVRPVGREVWELSVRDDGRGVDPAVTRRQGGGRGLEGMKRRAESLGGTLTVDSAPGHGTTVTLRFDPAGHPVPTSARGQRPGLLGRMIMRARDER